MHYSLVTQHQAVTSSVWRPGIAQALLLGYFSLFGLFMGASGVLWDSLQQALRLGDGVFGTAMLVTPLVGGAVLLAVSPLAAWIGIKWLALASLAIIAASLGGIALTNVLWVFVAVRALSGVGYGLMEGVINSATLDWEQATGRPTMNLMHAAISGGAVAGALAAGAFLGAGGNYQQVLLILAFLSLLLCVGTLPVQFPPPPTNQHAAARGRTTLGVIVRQRALIVFITLCLLAASAEALIGFWSVIYLRDLGASVFISGAAFALFNGAMFAGRLLNTLVVARWGTRVSLALSSAGVGVATTLLAVPSVACTVVAFAILGLALAGVIPTVLTGAARLASEYATPISSVILLAAFAGFVVAPPVVGWAAASFGLYAALLGTLGVVGLAMLGLVRALRS